MNYLSYCKTLVPIVTTVKKNVLPLNQVRSVSSGIRTKVQSKRKYKKYKLKNHRGASSRWLLIEHGNFLRKQAATNHLNRKMRAWKRYAKKKKVIANVQQRNLLKKLIPYWKKNYMKRIVKGVNPNHINY
ncbi:hypothetical protein HDU92_008406 [Lobulomyces angularis]|nr:hypothetical protein HDU92_008406 [Lobulomyces angularis]